MQHETPSFKPSVSFSGAISEVYEQVLGDFLFEPFAADLLQRIKHTAALNILELAAGTGRVTKKLAVQLPVTTHIIATDLEAEMLAVAQRNIHHPNLSWNIVDMMHIPYQDNYFDLVVCQFGLMLVPDKQKALQEMQRVLKPGGKLILSVWGNLDDNIFWKTGGEVINALIGINPITLDPGPFSMNEQDTLLWLTNAGFKQANATLVKQTGQIATAAEAAKGFINGLPVHLAIRKKDAGLLPVIEQALETALIKELGDQPMKASLTASLFEAIK